MNKQLTSLLYLPPRTPYKNIFSNGSLDFPVQFLVRSFTAYNFWECCKENLSSDYKTLGNFKVLYKYQVMAKLIVEIPSKKKIYPNS